MSGIVFKKSGNLPVLRQFYTETIGCELWLDQGGCNLFRHGNFLFGFCQSDTVETDGILTFFYPTMEAVDRMYAVMKATADAAPRTNDRFRIYQFFARDPENRILEFQFFHHPVAGHFTGEELLLWRRSVRQFTHEAVPDDQLGKILEICRYSPTSMNSQAYFYKIITDQKILKWLSETRGQASAPLANAPMAILVCADPARTRRPEQDADIAAYHFMLAARQYGLGTCWIAALNRDDIKQKLQIPAPYYISTITPLGWPATETSRLPTRREISELLL